MLVLTRTRDQAVMIGDDISVTVADIRGDKVRLGFNAPRHVQVHRKEIYDQIKQENQSAAGLAPEDFAGVVKSPGMTPKMKIAGDRPEDRFISAALEEAAKSVNEGGRPIGAVLVRNNQIISRGRDRSIQNQDAMAVAEMECIRNSGRQAQYRDTVLYMTLSPGDLGFAMAAHLGLPKIVAGESVHRPAGTYRKYLDSSGVTLVDLADAECIEMVDAFIRSHPERWAF